MSQPTMYVVGGPNGAGKTTLSVKYTSELNAVYVGADKIAFEISPDDPAKANVAAGRKFIETINDHILAGDSLVVETTLSGRSYRRLIETARKADYRVSITFVFVDQADTCVARVKQRVRKGGHHVPEQDVRRRFSRSIRNFWGLYRNLADEWTLLYNGDDRHVPVSKGVEEDFRIVSEPLFEKFMTMYEDMVE
jgi:predicted ABC-type ATPase